VTAGPKKQTAAFTCKLCDLEVSEHGVPWADYCRSCAIAWAMGKLTALSCLDRFPNEDSLTMVAKAFLQIVGPIPANDYEEDGGPDGDGPVMVHVPGLSEDETAEWLIGEILKTCDRFPAPIRMRQIYESRWTSSDGQLSGALLARIRNDT